MEKDIRPLKINEIPEKQFNPDKEFVPDYRVYDKELDCEYHNTPIKIKCPCCEDWK
jgi:hypothetical protein